MNLYTFIMDYKGGTYISQSEAANEHEAMIIWIQNLDTTPVEGFPKLINGSLLKMGSPLTMGQPLLPEYATYGVFVSEQKRDLQLSIL